MPDEKYCYPNSNILKNKINIKNKQVLLQAEIEMKRKQNEAAQ